MMNAILVILCSFPKQSPSSATLFSLPTFDQYCNNLWLVNPDSHLLIFVSALLIQERFVIFSSFSFKNQFLLLYPKRIKL